MTFGIDGSSTRIEPTQENIRTKSHVRQNKQKDV